ncbi:protein kinase family protein [Nocardioides sp. CFH 31398]|uniref:protein kinase family protein n=1 Tax=Nocardioides sp. CFH 31398 TaxID=2919579 RepID=UPI001F05EC88|nr:protein kinase family protein [Nocardioides sp. CFH 31398]MCH1865710.1 hypothetical protein [Nocardioides sp. CFH 31398]
MSAGRGTGSPAEERSAGSTAGPSDEQEGIEVHQGVRPGDVLADRYLLVDLLTESGGGRFWRAHDRVLARHVAMHVVADDDPRAGALLDAARRSATVADRHLLRVLDAERRDGLCYVVNEWGHGRSLDIVLGAEGPLTPRRAAWLVREAADALVVGHAAGVPHGHLVPENLLVDRSGAVRLIGFAVDGALRGEEASPEGDVRALAGLLYAALTGRWPGPPPSHVPEAPRDGDTVLRPRQVRAGITRALDTVCDEILNPPGTHVDGGYDATRLSAVLSEIVGDDSGMAAAEAARHRSALDAQPDGRGAPAWAARAREAARENDPEQPALRVDTPATAPLAVPATEPVPAAETAVRGVASPAAPAAGLPVDSADTVVAARRGETDAPTEHGRPLGPAEPVGPREPVGPSEPLGSGTRERDVSAEPGPPTEAGMPIFDDEADEVEWLRHHTETPAPPPPFEDPPERPLFAPGPPDDSRTHRGRREEASRHGGDGGFWPWDTGSPGAAAPPPLDDEVPDEDDEVPGRRWLVLGVALILAVLVGVGGVYAFNVGGDGSPFGGDEPSSEPSPRRAAPSAEPLRIEGVRDFDPQGDPPEESPEEAPLAVDGDPETVWSTSTYFDQFGPAGLKTGVGLLVDLGEFRDVSGVSVDVRGETGLAVYVADTEPTGVADLPRLAEGSGDGTVDLTLDEPDTGRYVVVWVDSLPQVDDGFRAEIAEITVLG